jgi:ribosomal protein S18 acetylase RimI-like enzyme
MHRRDINRAWDFLKLVFRGVNQKTVEYQRPRSKTRFEEVYDDEGVDQLLFEVDGDIVGYAECSYSTSGADNWMNPRYFDKRGMRPLFVDELAVHPLYQGKGVGGFMLEQAQHLARTRGCTHLVLEVAQNNKAALTWYHKRNFYRLDAAIFLAQKVPVEPELLPARPLKAMRHAENGGGDEKATLALPITPRAGLRPKGGGATGAPKASKAGATETRPKAGATEKTSKAARAPKKKPPSKPTPDRATKPAARRPKAADAKVEAPS